MKYQDFSREEKQKELSSLQKQYEAFCAKGLSLDLSRGKPSSEQLDLCDGILAGLSKDDCFDGKLDLRNYGIFDGVGEMRRLFSDLYGVKEDRILVGGNSSLQMMHDTLFRFMLFGTGNGATPWAQVPGRKWLCVVPGYDRHFAITGLLGFQMINIPMRADGPDMDMVEAYAKDPDVKGIWCIPKYSNPSGNTYSEEVIRRLVSMKTAPDFRIFWDNAYAIHDMEEEGDVLPDVFALAEEAGTVDRIMYFASTSKVTFPGAGVAFMAASEANLAYLRPMMNLQTIGADKINQIRHIRFLKDKDTALSHMKKLGKFMKGKFDIAASYLSELDGTGTVTWTHPKGGYFISLDVLPGCAKRVYELMKNAGVILTKVGATFPYGIDPEDKNLRLAPSYPADGDLRLSMEALVLSIRIASLERLLK